MKRGAKLKTVHVFDWEGNFIESLTTPEILQKYSMKKGALSGCINRESCYGYQFYFSYDRNFIPNLSKRFAHSLTAKGASGTHRVHKKDFVFLPPFVDMNELSF